ncbi:hypothetical protein GQX74_006275 [Glossina fuscipes]|nr:hypothetical protein GQX74_006275 [Glossina fuscipes]
MEWRQKLDTQRGAVLANELRNNACKLAKWTVQAVLAGSDQLKLDYVSRINSRDPSRHVILGTQQFKPQLPLEAFFHSYCNPRAAIVICHQTIYNVAVVEPSSLKSNLKLLRSGPLESAKGFLTIPPHSKAATWTFYLDPVPISEKRY